MFQDSNAPWYLLALCIWYLSVPLLERIKAGYLIVGSLCIGVLVGYISCINSVFALSRVLCFFRFLSWAFVCRERNLETFLDKKLRIPAIIILVAVFLGITLFWKELSPVKNYCLWIFTLLRILKGTCKKRSVYSWDLVPGDDAGVYVCYAAGASL